MHNQATPADLGLNERRILDLIWRRGPIARTALAEASGLTPASVTRLIQFLDQRALIEEAIERSGTRGQPCRPISIASSGAHSIGVYFSHSTVELGLLDLGGSPLHVAAHHSEELTPAELRNIIDGFVDSAILEGFIDTKRMLGIGIALPGDFSASDQLHAHAYFPAFAGQNAIRELAREQNFPIFIENDSASAALGERLFGAGQGIDDFLFVHIGHGVGGALIQGGRLYRGVNGNAGMIGIQFPKDRARPSGQDLFNHLNQAGVRVSDFPDIDHLSPTACPPLKAWLQRAGSQLREQLSITARIFDPAAIILGGRLPLPLLNHLVSEIDAPGFCAEGVGLPRPRVLSSTLGRRAGLLGAAALPVFRQLLDTNDAPASCQPGIRL